MELGRIVSYIDAFGKTHDALVTAVNQLHDGYISVVYVGDGEDPIKRVYDIPHMNDPSRQEMRSVPVSNQELNPGKTVQDGNPDLPTYVLNCWKEDGDHHVELPSDHPAFDPPFAWPKADEHGNFPVVSRKEFEAHQAAWKQYCASQPSAADLDADAADKANKAATRQPVIETKVYSDGSSATGVAPLPTRSPAQQDQDEDVAKMLDAAGQEAQGAADPPVA